MINIFENAYFGKAYKTRDGRKAVFYNHHNNHAREKANYVTMILEGQESIYRWYYDGTATAYQKHLDIITEWHEPIDEHEIEALANTAMWKYSEMPDAENIGEYKEGWFDGYKQGWEDRQ